MEPTLGELARALAELHQDVQGCTERVDKMREIADRTYLRQDLAEQQHKTIDVQLAGFEGELHSLHKRVEAGKDELLIRITEHDKAHQAENESRTGYRRQFTIALVAAILSPLVGALLTVIIVLTLGVHK